MRSKPYLMLWVAGLLAGCNNTDSKNNAVATAPAPPAQEHNISGCYTYKTDQVSINLLVKTLADTVTGTLTYDYAEKDDNTGTIKGTFSGDTLFADYTFLSEGFETVREVAFIKSGDKLKEGYGDIEDRNGKIVFKDRGFLIFPGRVTLTKGACGK